MRPFARVLGCSLLLIVLVPSVCMAILVDKKQGKWSLLGRLKLEATFRTVDAPDNNPIPIEAGDLVTQRNLLFLEWRHDLGNITSWLSFNYFLQFRFFYDSAWDVGPDVLKDDGTRNFYLFDNRDVIDDLKWDADLFIGYFDLASGPVFLRVGRQVMSWGEMTTLRILDGINPTDNTSLAVDLLERLVPLFMARVNLAFDYVGPFSSVSLDPPLVLWNLQDSSDVYDVYASPRYFAINVLALQQQELSSQYARKGQHEIEPAHYRDGKFFFVRHFGDTERSLLRTVAPDDEKH